MAGDAASMSAALRVLPTDTLDEIELKATIREKVARERKVRLQTQILRGQYLPRDQVETLVAQAAAVLRTELLRLPDEVCPLAEGMTADEAATEWHERLSLVLNRFAEAAGEAADSRTHLRRQEQNAEAAAAKQQSRSRGKASGTKRRRCKAS